MPRSVRASCTPCFTSWLDASSSGIRLVFKLVPDISSEELAHKRLSTFREDWEASELLSFLKVRSAFDLFFSSCCTSSSGSRLSSSTKLFFLSDHSLNTIVHVLDEIDFGPSKSPLVGDIVDVVSRFRVLSVDSSNLDVELVSNGLKLWHSNAELGQCNMN